MSKSVKVSFGNITLKSKKEAKSFFSDYIKNKTVINDVDVKIFVHTPYVVKMSCCHSF